jgi:AraC-like DNA-binding protein
MTFEDAAGNILDYTEKTYEIDLESDKPITEIHLPEDMSINVIDFEICDNVNINPFVIRLSENNALQAMFLKAEAEWQSNKTACRASCLSIAYGIISTAARFEECFLHPGKYEKIYSAVEYLHEHYTEQNFRIDMLSEISGINSAYFARLFASKFGMSPKEYVLELKMRRAMELLSQEKYSVSEIGSLLGYSDVYHFSKSFKHSTGVSPTEWRASSGIR